MSYMKEKFFEEIEDCLETVRSACRPKSAEAVELELQQFKVGLLRAMMQSSQQRYLHELQIQIRMENKLKEAA